MFYKHLFFLAFIFTFSLKAASKKELPDTVEACVQRMNTIFKKGSCWFAEKQYPYASFKQFEDQAFPEIAKILLEKPVADHDRNKYGQSLLHKTCMMSVHDKYTSFEKSSLKDETIKALLLLGFSPNLEDDDYATPLYFAIAFFKNPLCDFKSIEILLNAGAKTNILTKLGMTPLSYILTFHAQRFSTDDMQKLIKLLLAHGADPFFPQNSSLSPASRVENLYQNLYDQDPFLKCGGMYERLEASKTYEWFIEMCKSRSKSKPQ